MDLIGSFLRLDSSATPGQLSIGTGNTWVLTIIAVVVLVVRDHRQPAPRVERLGLALGLSGARSASLTDRIVRLQDPRRGPFLNYDARSSATSPTSPSSAPAILHRAAGDDRAERRRDPGDARESRAATRRPTIEARTLFVPDGLEGERVDAAIARLVFGLSQTRSELPPETYWSPAVGWVSAGDLLEVALPRAEDSPSLAVITEPVPEGDDRPRRRRHRRGGRARVGVAAHPSVGWTGPDGARPMSLQRGTGPRRASQDNGRAS